MLSSLWRWSEHVSGTPHSALVPLKTVRMRCEDWEIPRKTEHFVSVYGSPAECLQFSLAHLSRKHQHTQGKAEGNLTGLQQSVTKLLCDSVKDHQPWSTVTLEKHMQMLINVEKDLRQFLYNFVYIILYFEIIYEEKIFKTSSYFPERVSLQVYHEVIGPS